MATAALIQMGQIPLAAVPPAGQGETEEKEPTNNKMLLIALPALVAVAVAAGGGVSGTNGTGASKQRLLPMAREVRAELMLPL